MKNNLIKTILLAFIAFPIITFTQTAPFELIIEPLNISNLGGLQSFAFGQHEGKLLVAGGRLDGLHTRQPFASFDIAGHNNRLFVIDPIEEQSWSADLTSLPNSIQEQLSSTNMEFYQEGEYLYCFGGYGFSPAANNHITYDKLTAIKVPEVINAIINGDDFSQYFRQITDEKFQVTGGHIEKIGENYYMLGGQKFIGRYNPMGPNHGQGFQQEYTNSIRIFNITDDGVNITIDHLEEFTDSENLHRRDYNATAQIMPNGEEGITMFSGVFQHNVDIPFLNCVNINAEGYNVNNEFQQYYNHYHCPVLPLYSASDNEMHTVFFGGIAQYYDDNGTLVQDDNVPFVKTIARVTRDADGNMAEYKLPIEMPELLGASAEFILNEDLPRFDNEVIKLDDISADTTHVGYIYGGISSSAPNIFFSNNGTQSIATSQMFKVYLVNNKMLSVDDKNEQSNGSLNMRLYPNPNKGLISISYRLIKQGNVTITITDLKGNLIHETTLKNQQIGENKYSHYIENISNGNVYFVTVEIDYEKSTQKLILER